MPKITLCAFSDESSPVFEEQIAALLRNNVPYMEMRNVDGKNVKKLTLDEAKEYKKRLDDKGLAVWSIGSPIGKSEIADDFQIVEDTLKHVCELALTLGTDKIRMFSFHHASEAREEVISRLCRMVEIAKDYGVGLYHENEKGIYGDIAPRCRELLDLFPALDNIFDPANFIQAGQDTLEGWKLLCDRTKYLHIKDALADGRVVPAGKGIGNVKAILTDFMARGGSAVTIEPHLTVFAGLKDLERAGEETKIDEFSYESSDAAFDVACNALRACL